MEMNPPDSEVARILRDARVIAVVGLSPNTARASHDVAGFLLKRGYEIIPVNPVAAGERIHGRTVVATLAEAAEADMVDIFRRSEAVPEIVDAALAGMPALKTIWMQLGVVHPEAAAKAQAAGVAVVQDRCPKIEIPRLGLS